MNVLITGADGFIGKNLQEALSRLDKVNVQTFTRQNSLEDLDHYLDKADIIYHLAGVNRPKNEDEFVEGNVELTKRMTESLNRQKRNPKIIFSSSSQADKDNPYGRSKKEAEAVLIQYARETSAELYIYRLPNIFGKWCRPNYNSVVSTFCYNVAHDLAIEIDNPDVELDLIYINDVINEFMRVMEEEKVRQNKRDYYFKASPVYRVTLKKLADTIFQFKKIRETLWMPDLSDPFTEALYSTYLSYIDKDELSYQLDVKADHRGSLAELFKSKHFGQVFMSKSNQGVVRGNHYHNHKVEKFCVISGKAEIKLRCVLSDKVVSYIVSGEEMKIVDIPPGYTHSLENLTDQELIVLFWANEAFDSKNPDTYYEEV